MKLRDWMPVWIEVEYGPSKIRVGSKVLNVYQKQQIESLSVHVNFLPLIVMLVAVVVFLS